MIIKSSQFAIQHKTLDVKESEIQIKNKLGKDFIWNDQTLNNQTSVKSPTIDANKNRDLLMQMLAINPQVVTAPDQLIVTVKNNDQENANNRRMKSKLPSPVNLTAIEEKMKIVLSWDSVSMALSYNVKRSTTSDGPYSIIANNIIKSSYTDIKVKKGITYYYVVTSLNEYAESKNSNEVSVTMKK